MVGDDFQFIEMELAGKHVRGPDDKHVLRWRWKWLHDRGGCGVGLKCRGRKGEGRPYTGDSGRE